MIPGGSRGVTIGKTILTCVYIEKEIFSTSRPISIKLGTNHSCMKGNQVYSNEGSSPLQRGDNNKGEKSRVGLFRYFLLMNHSTTKAQIYISASDTVWNQFYSIHGHQGL
jgi:hypothetical protein